MAKLQCNFPVTLDTLDADRVTGQDILSATTDVIETAITQMQLEMRRVTAKTATTTLTVNEGGLILVSCAVTPYTLFLPTAVGNGGLTYDFIKTDDNTNLITVDADGTETINGSLTFTDLNYQYARMKLRSDNANWIIVTTSQTTTIRVTDLISPISNSINVKPDGDTDDFFTFKSLQDRPTIKREGGKFIYFESSNVYDVGISFRADDTYSGTLNYEKDNHMMTVLGKNSPFGFKANSDYVNYLKVQTVSTIPEITVVASGGLKVNAGGSNALLLNHSGGNVGIGTTTPSRILELYNDTIPAIGFRQVGAAVNNRYWEWSVAGERFRGMVQNDANDTEQAWIQVDRTANTIDSITFPQGVINVSGGQIAFPATAVPSADANTLDDYEEGTWTMGISFGGGTTGITYSSNTGYYTKIGNVVTISGLMVLTSKGTDNGDALITGLPFTGVNSYPGTPAVSLRLKNVSFADHFQGYINLNTTTIILEETTNAGVTTALVDTNLANNSEIIVNVTYRIE